MISKEAIQISFLVILLIAVGALISATVTIYKYKDMLANPVGYNMKQFGLEFCSCQNNKGQFVQINAVGDNHYEPINVSNYVSCGNNLQTMNLNFTLQ